jgi:hypothetical protein
MFMLHDFEIPVLTEPVQTNIMQPFSPVSINSSTEPPKYDNDDLTRRKVDSFVETRLLPVINDHCHRLHHRLRIVILPNSVKPAEIASDVTIGHETYPVEFVTLKEDHSLPDTKFLTQQSVQNILIEEISRKSSVSKCQITLCQETIRKTNDFGLYVSETVDLLQITLKII